MLCLIKTRSLSKQQWVLARRFRVAKQATCKFLASPQVACAELDKFPLCKSFSSQNPAFQWYLWAYSSVFKQMQGSVFLTCAHMHRCINAHTQNVTHRCSPPHYRIPMWEMSQQLRAGCWIEELCNFKQAYKTTNENTLWERREAGMAVWHKKSVAIL